MRNYATFRGRASRAEFWVYTLIVIILAVVVSVIDQGMVHPLSPMSGVLLGLFTLVHILPSIAVQVRRLHDIDRTGWWMLLNVTGIGAIVTLIFVMLGGTQGPNRFGPMPQGSNADGYATANSGGGYGAYADPAFAAPQAALRVDHTHVGRQGSPNAPNAALSTSQGQHDTIADIERLAKLRDSDSITDAEFEAMKRQLLER
ncbi:DUF805 domain-containing protein [Aureimonas psammosilenae]|uniref:DUF805 domain-containing protein n=1 Tax=Aureimonas psammosilenae TaxID=2495496 RepID=UPI0012611D0F|nr:DUF805 domain-containing protein [Aureimonas psammosilenae]